MPIYIDADACPVKEEVYRVARRYAIRVFVVANAPIRVPNEDPIELIVVRGGFDAADDRIVESVATGDIVITTDIPLADRCIRAVRGCWVRRGSSSPRTRSAKPWRPAHCSRCSGSRASSAAGPPRLPRRIARDSSRSSMS